MLYREGIKSFILDGGVSYVEKRVPSTIELAGKSVYGTASGFVDIHQPENPKLIADPDGSPTGCHTLHF